MDPILNVMLYLKNQWTLTGDFTSSKIHFSTGWYDGNIMFPQVSVTPYPSQRRPLTSGPALYSNFDNIRINIWVRPNQSSNTSIGWGKNAIYVIRREIDRIFLSGSNISVARTGPPYTSEENVFLGNWRDLTEINRNTGRPVIFRQEVIVTDFFTMSYTES